MSDSDKEYSPEMKIDSDKTESEDNSVIQEYTDQCDLFIAFDRQHMLEMLKQIDENRDILQVRQHQTLQKEMKLSSSDQSFISECTLQFTFEKIRI